MYQTDNNFIIYFLYNSFFVVRDVKHIDFRSNTVDLWYPNYIYFFYNLSSHGHYRHYCKLFCCPLDCYWNVFLDEFKYKFHLLVNSSLEVLLWNTYHTKSQNSLYSLKSLMKYVTINTKLKSKYFVAFNSHM